MVYIDSRETDLSFVCVVMGCTARGPTSEITKSQTVISEICHCGVLLAGALANFSNDSPAFHILRRYLGITTLCYCRCVYRCYQVNFIVFYSFCVHKVLNVNKG